MRMFGLLPRPLGSIFRKLTHLACNSRLRGGKWKMPRDSSFFCTEDEFASPCRSVSLLRDERVPPSVQKRSVLRGEAFRPFGKKRFPLRADHFSSSRRSTVPLHGEALPTLHGERVGSTRRTERFYTEKVSSQHGEQSDSTRRKNQVSV